MAYRRRYGHSTSYSEGTTVRNPRGKIIGEPIIATVRCMNKHHTIVRQMDGRITLVNHMLETIDDVLTMRALGGDIPRCFEVLEAWQFFGSRAQHRMQQNENYRPKLLKDLSEHGIAMVLPKPLLELRDKCRRTGYERRMQNQRSEPLVSLAYLKGNEQAISRRISPIINDALNSLQPQLTQRYPIGDAWNVMAKNGNRPWPIPRQMIVLDLQWYMHIFKRGLAIVDGWLVTGIKIDKLPCGGFVGEVATVGEYRKTKLAYVNPTMQIIQFE